MGGDLVIGSWEFLDAGGRTRDLVGRGLKVEVGLVRVKSVMRFGIETLTGFLCSLTSYPG